MGLGLEHLLLPVHAIRASVDIAVEAIQSAYLDVSHHDYLVPVAAPSIVRSTAADRYRSIISMCQGATHSYEGILACRFFLGLAVSQPPDNTT